MAVKKLNPEWVTQGLIDFEYKKYVLLDYIQYVGKQFKDYKLYPYQSDILQQHRYLKSIAENQQLFFDKFPKFLKEISTENMKNEFETKSISSPMMEEIKKIINFSIPLIENKLKEGASLYDEIENVLKMETVGLRPINLDEGYVMVQLKGMTNVFIYNYQLKLFEHANEKYRGIFMEYLGDEVVTISNNIENIKLSLVKQNESMPNPCTFYIHSSLKLPYKESVLPIVKRMVVQEIAKAA